GDGEVHIAVGVRTQARRRHTRSRAGCVTLCRALEIGEKEKFVFAAPDRWSTLTEMRQDDWTTDGITELGQNVFRILHLVRRLKKASRPEAAVCIVTPAGAVKVVSATLDTDVDRRPAGEALLSVERVRDDVHFLYGFGRRHVNRIGRQPRVDDAGAVDLRVVLQTRNAVD